MFCEVVKFVTLDVGWENVGECAELRWQVRVGRTLSARHRLQDVSLVGCGCLAFGKGSLERKLSGRS